MYQDTSSPSFSPRNFFLVPKSFCRSKIMALFISFRVSEKDSEGSDVVFHQKSIVNLASDLLAALAPSSPVLASYPCAARSLGWTRASVPSSPIDSGELSDARSFPPRPSDEPSSIRCHPAPPKPPGSSAWPSPRL